ncbi:hypothetical protein LWI28_028327 [Acer negundo]|uniref:Uncharacterized protein n=1 Tax=Acer negundo TaxID=4023 RepID=A0AAD5JBA6_ACENE|nr:hypothetical protein LWI28_028327 [Acer negundo]
MQTKNMLKRKREQQDIQLLARMGVVDSSKYKSNMYQVVTSRVTNNLETQNNMRHVVKRGTCNNMESMSDDSETEEPSDHDIEETEDDSGSTCKKTRGRTRLQWLHLQKEPIQVKRNELCQPIGEPASPFVMPATILLPAAPLVSLSPSPVSPAAIVCFSPRSGRLSDTPFLTSAKSRTSLPARLSTRIWHALL